MLEGLVDGMQLLHTLIQTLLSTGGDKTPLMLHSEVWNVRNLPEDSSIRLHGLLHVQPDGSCRLGAIRVAHLIQEIHTLKPSFIRDLHVRLARSKGLLDVVGTSTAEDDNVQKRVCTKTVGTMHGYTRSLASSIQTRNDLVLAILY